MAGLKWICNRVWPSRAGRNVPFCHLAQGGLHTVIWRLCRQMTLVCGLVLCATAASAQYATTASEAPAAASSEVTLDKRLLARQVLFDLEFILLTWKSPGTASESSAADREAHEVWTRTTQTRLNDLNSIAAHAGLPDNVGNAIGLVMQMLNAYKQLLESKGFINYAAANHATQGAPSLLTLLPGRGTFKEIDTTLKIAGSIAAAKLVAVVAAVELISAVGASAERQSRLGKIEVGRAAFLAQKASSTQADVAALVESLNYNASLIAEEMQISVPAFALWGRGSSGSISADSPFRLVLEAHELLAKDDEDRAAARFAAAAQSFPGGGSPIGRYYARNYAVPYYLIAGQLAQFGAEKAGIAESAASSAAVAHFRAASRLLGPEQFSAADRLAYAYALASTGQSRDARDAEDQATLLLRESISDTADQAVHLYEVAAIHARIGNSSKALDLLEQSYRIYPRRDRYLAVDPRFTSLRESGLRDLLNMIDHPLIGGIWSSPQFGQYYFYPSGTLFQIDGKSRRWKGKWSAAGPGQLRLFDRIGADGTREDSLANYSIERGVSSGSDTLQMHYQGNTFVYSRADDNFMPGDAVIAVAGRTFSNSGSWRWKSGEDALHARFFVVTPSLDKKREVWCLWRHQLYGLKRHQCAEKM